MDFERLCKKTVLYISAAFLVTAAAYVFVRYIAAAFLPFIIAFALAFAARPVKRYIRKKSKMPERAAAIISVGGILAAVFLAAALFVRQAASEMGRVYEYLTEHTDLYAILTEKALGIAERISELIPNLAFPDITPSDKLAALFSEITPIITARLGEAIASAAKSVPNCLVFAAITVISSFYFSADLDRICKLFSAVFPMHIVHAAGKTRVKMASAALKYVKAYLLVIAVTFTELYVGLSLLKVPYALSLSVTIAIIDILPVLGTGTVLLPWTAVSFLLGDSFMGVGILVLYIIITVVRQFVEPRIVGKSIGLYPPLALIGMYIGVKVMGFAGIFLGPLAVIAIKSAAASYAGGKSSEEK